jgi:hypothetical protein
VALLATAAGCHLLRQPRPQPNDGDWAMARDRFTRRAYLYDGLDHRATASATLLTPAVREARARRLADWFGWTPAELEQRLAQEKKEAAEGEEVFLSFYTADSRANDLDAPRPIWRVAVKLDGVDLVARRIGSIDRDANTLALFPYIGPFDVAYRVSFPPAPGGPLSERAFTLEIASGAGKLALDFNDGGGEVMPQLPVPSH